MIRYDKQHLEILLLEYEKRREGHMKMHWQNPRSPFGRIWGRERAYAKLRNEDIRFSAEIQAWFADYFMRERIDCSQLKDFVVYLKNHNLRLTDRSHFLTILITILGAVLLIRQIPTPSPQPVIITGALVLTVIGGLLFVSAENSVMKERTTICDEVIHIIEREISRLEEHPA